MPKSTKPPRGRTASKSRSLVPSKPQSVALTVPGRLTLGGSEIHPEQFVQIPERRPYGEGPWRNEPDRIAWRDGATGYSCLIQRQANGSLSGYVAVMSSHPLWAYERDAIPTDLGISPHEGLDYAALCDQNAPPMLRICHVDHPVRARQHVPTTADSDASGGPDAWWFGFDTDKPEDFLPRGYARNDLHREAGKKVYRDLAYVAGEVVDLAARLKALEDQTASVGSDGTPDTGVPLLLNAKPKALLPPTGGSHD